MLKKVNASGGLSLAPPRVGQCSSSRPQQRPVLLKTHLSSATWFWASLIFLLLLVGIRFEILQRRTLANQDPPGTLVAFKAAQINISETAAKPQSRPESAPPAYAFIGPIASTESIDEPIFPRQAIIDTLRRDDSIYLSLKKHRISEAQIVQLTRALKSVFNSKKESKPGDIYTLATQTNNAIQYFKYIPRLAPHRPVLIERKAGQLAAQRLDLPLDTLIVVVQASIEDNLYNAISTAGEGPELIDLVADDIFGSVIEFSKHTRKGDRIGIIFEKFYLREKFIDYGRILLANYDGQFVSQLAVHYISPEGHKGYYDDAGKSLARMFLLNSLPYRARISSSFSRRRFHPILKRPIPHLGTDYAAPTGTRVRATARGTIVHAGWKGGYGKLVEIKHPNGYRTRYAHLSQISVKKGQHVPQAATIGKVGATGRATGPHLHYEVIKNGSHQNPETLNKNVKGKPLPKNYLQAFAAHRDRLLRQLESDQPPPGSPPVLTAKKEN
mgnify:CR=1 FL=1